MTAPPAPPSRRGSVVDGLMLALIAAGIALRARGPQLGVLSSDGAWYATMAESLRRYHEFLVPWASPAPTYFQHFPPLYPAMLAGVFSVMGPTMTGVYAMGFLSAAFLAVVCYLTTLDLYGRRAALAVTALAVTVPVLVLSDAEGLSETLVTALFALTIWAIVKSIDRPPFILLGGLFAGLSYLSKASMGPFLFLAAGAGFAWRFWYARWRVFRDAYYLGAGLIFLAFIGLWAYRNASHFGIAHWETQPYATQALHDLFARPTWPADVAVGLVALLLVVLAIAVPSYRELEQALLSWLEERTSVLWLAVVTPLLVAAFFVAAFSQREDWNPLGSEHTGRYAITCLVPLLWLALRSAPLELPTDRRVSALALAGGVVVAVTVGLDPRSYVTTPSRNGVMFLGLFVGLVLLATSTLVDTVPSARKLKGRRATATKQRPVVALAVAGVLALGSVPLPILWFPLAAAAVAGLAVSRPSLRVIVIALIFLAAGLQGVSGSVPFEQVAKDVAAVTPPGGSVAVLEGHEPYLWPFLPASLRVVTVDANPDVIVDEPTTTQHATPPLGYKLLREYPIEEHVSPLTSLSRWIQRHTGAQMDEVDNGIGARVFVRA